MEDDALSFRITISDNRLLDRFYNCLKQYGRNSGWFVIYSNYENDSLYEQWILKNCELETVQLEAIIYASSYDELRMVVKFDDFEYQNLYLEQIV